jgi:uncharacterized iron-regulated membrane protein
VTHHVHIHHEKTHYSQPKIHYWLSLVVLLPFTIVVLTGLLLLLKKDWAWVHPPTQKGSARVPSLSFEKIYAISYGMKQLEIQSWNDIERIDFQPQKGIAKIQSKNHWELQIDMQTGSVLHLAYRRSDVIESLHDGTFFHDYAKYALFLPSGIAVAILLLSGGVLFIYPLYRKQMRSRNQTLHSSADT